MKFNRESESDQFVKDQTRKQATKYAKKAAKSAMKKMGGKAGKAAGDAAGKAVQAGIKKIIALVANAIGGTSASVFIIAVLVLLVLPSLIFSSLLGIDGANSESGVSDIVDSSWEEDAQNAIDERYQDLKEATFWADIGTFFTTGEWGTEGHFFETEYANARDMDTEGTDDYFSASNRLIAIINETYRLSLKYGRVVDDAVALANASKPNIESQYRNSAEYGPNGIEEGNYTITLNVEQDPNFNVEDMNFIYESCYLLAASSSSVNETGEYATGIRKALDFAFESTGLDGATGTDICMEPIVRSECVACVEEDHYVYYAKDAEENVYRYTNEADIPEGQVVFYTDHWKTKDVTVNIYYSASMVSDWKDVINEHCDVETELPEGASSLEITEAEQVETSALQLANFYVGGDGSASIGEAGLPLPRDSYYISSRFGWRVIYGQPEFHLGVDLATYHRTPPVYTVKDGVCIAAGYSGSYGNRVIIDHGDGLTTLYAHMSAITVSEGQTVTAGDQIGIVGSTGNSTGEHLHFEIRFDGEQVDPLQTELGPLISEAANG